LTVRKPIERPSTAPEATSAKSSRARLPDQAPARVKPAVVFPELEPHPDRLGGVVLKQHRDAAQAPQAQRLAKRARHHHVARGVDLAEQAA